MTKKRHSAAVQQKRNWDSAGIGVFGGAPSAAADTPYLTTPIYWFYEMSLAALNPSRAFADLTKLYFKSPINPSGAFSSPSITSSRYLILPSRTQPLISF